jgi:dGTPase
LNERKLCYEIVRRMIGRVVGDLIEASAAQLRSAAPKNIEDVRAASEPLIAMSDVVAAEHRELKQFLRHEMYRHYRVLRMTDKARKVIRDLFDAFTRKPELLPNEHQRVATLQRETSGDAGLARAVADYIAGMTDRYAIREHQRMFDPAERS